MNQDEVDAEIRRLRAQAIAQGSRIRELEDALAKCVMERRIELRDILAYDSDNLGR